MAHDEDEPLTPAGRYFTQPSMQQIINVAFGVANPIDKVALKREIDDTFLKRYPRFSCKVVRGEDGKEYWRKVEDVDMDKHVFEIKEDGNEKVDEYMASLSVSTPLDFGKPLWEVHLLPRHRCYVLRLHHALGDGISLMSLFLSGCRRVDDPRLLPTIPAGGPQTRRTTKASPGSIVRRLFRPFSVVWYTMWHYLDFTLHALWVRDKKTPISGGEGVEMWPRKLEVVKFNMDDMRIVKKPIIDATINDVLLGVVACGLERYLDLRSPDLRKPLRISGLVMVNTRKQPGLQEISNMTSHKSRARWGNQFGYIILPIRLRGGTTDPLDYVRRANALTKRKKLSLEAHLTYASGAMVMSLFGPKAATSLNYRVLSGTTFTISNVVGPSDQISFAGNPITSMKVTSSSLPHVQGLLIEKG